MNRLSVGALLLLGVGVMGGRWLAATEARADDGTPAVSERATLVLNVTSGKDDPHAVTMALQLAGHALDDGREVVIFLNVRAAPFATKGAPSHLKFADNPPVGAMLETLMQRGTTVLVCPSCAKVMGVEESDLVPGARFATRELLFSRLGPNSCVFSY